MFKDESFVGLGFIIYYDLVVFKFVFYLRIEFFFNKRVECNVVLRVRMRK